jgi:outer membrane receptor protein involved in Fe transport
LKHGASLRQNLFLMTTVVSSSYDYKVMSRAPTNEFDWNAGIHYLSAKADASLTISEKTKIDFGLGVEHYKVNLGKLDPVDNSNFNPFSMDDENGLILFAYGSYQYDLSDKLSFRAGLRASMYTLKGPLTVNTYEEGKPKSEATYTGSDDYVKGDKIQDYHGFEPRFSVRYSITTRSSIKAGYDHTIQYLQLISNTSAVSPIDIWKLSDQYLKPQTGDQFSLGYFQAIKAFQFSLEGFYKKMDNVVDYKDGADLLLNDRLEADLLQGEGRAYGIEGMAEKKQGKLTGWISYTLSRTERKIESEFPEETISKGEYYPASYDKTHNVSVTTSYQSSKRVSWGFNFVFSSGRPITYPTASYDYGGVRVVNFELRNNERSPSYHRLDISLEIKSKERPERRWHSSWVISLYNVYARKNPYSIFFKSDYGVRAQSYQLAVIGTIVPSLSYTISF